MIRRGTLLADSTIATVAAVAGSAPGLAIPVAIAHMLGANSRTDAFFLALSVATLVANALGVTTQQASIPFVIEAAREKRHLGQFLGQISSALLLLSIIPTVLLSVGVSVYLSRQDTWAVENAQLLHQLFWLLAPFIAFSVVAGVYSGALNAEHHYVRVALSPAIRSAIVLVAVLTTGRQELYLVALGYVVGELARLIFLAASVRKRHPLQVLAKPTAAGLTGFAQTAIAQMFGSGILAFLPLVDRIMVARVGPGSVSLLDYADRIWQVPMGFAVSGFMVASLSHWSERFQKDGSIVALRRSTSRFALSGFVLALPLCGMLVAVCGPIMRMLFGSGRFGSAELSVLIDTFAAMTWGIPAYIAGLIYTRGFLVLKRSDLLFAVAVFQLIFKPIVNMLLIPMFGPVGVGISTALTYSAASILLALLFHLWIASIDSTEPLGGVVAETRGR